MKQPQPSPNRFSGTDWQTLGELEIRAGEHVEGSIQAWLIETLKLLDLQTDVLNRILISASEAVTCARQRQVITRELETIHLVAFAPCKHTSEGKTWGFFRLEKLGDQRPPVLSVEFYLYIEGQG